MRKYFKLVFLTLLVIFSFTVASCKKLFDGDEFLTPPESSERTTANDAGGGTGSGEESASELPEENPTYILYVSGSSGVLETAGSDSTGTGEESAPYATLQKAINHINTEAKNNIDWKIFVSGTVTGNTVISELKAASVTIKRNENANSSKLQVTSGSVIKIDAAANVIIEGITITGGTGTSVSGTSLGGGIYISNSSATVVLRGNAAVSGNNATEGGGVYNCGTLKISGDTTHYTIIKNNTASNGGGIYNYGNLYLDGFYSISENNQNPATGNGGGVYNAGTFNMTNNISSTMTGSISENNALEGGGVYNVGTFEMIAGSIIYNIAYDASNGGGGVFNKNTFIMSGGDIHGNEAYYANGGGVYNNGTMIMSGDAVIGEKDASDNADVDNYSNSATNGGGIYNAGNLTLGSEESSSDFTGGVYYNYAYTSGGGIYNTSGSTYSYHNGMISKNCNGDLFEE